MVGSAALKQGRSENRKHTFFFFGLNTIFEYIKALRVLMETMSCDFSSCRLSRVHFCR